MLKQEIIAYICTRGRYTTTLPLAWMSLINQTLQPNKIIIFDDNPENQRIDFRTTEPFYNILKLMDIKGIQWEVIFGTSKGQHHGHQYFNTRFSNHLLLRCDDDTVLEPNVLENLYSHLTHDVGAVGGAIITPAITHSTEIQPSGKISKIYEESNLQWFIQNQIMEVEHLHCSFLYRGGLCDYNTNLSKCGHREETMFTNRLYKKGLKLLIIPNTITYHLKMPHGGIRSEDQQIHYDFDELIFQNYLEGKESTIVVLDNGMGDHIVFKHILPELNNPIIFSCYPEIIPGRSIKEAQDLFGDLTPWNLYQHMSDWNWNDSIESAYRKLYNI